MPDQPDVGSASPTPPGPPFPVELIADLHAGVLPADVADALWPRVRADPDAMRVVAALDATRADLADAEITPEAPPPAVLDSIESTLAAIRAEATAADTPAASVPVESIEDARARQRDARRRRGMVRASIAAGIIAVVTLVIAVATATMSSSQGSDERADDAGSSVATPSSSPQTEVAAGTLLSFVGRSEPAFTGQTDPARLERCLAANGVATSVPVLGSGPVTANGRSAVVILLSTGVAGRFDALVVGTDCDAGTPATLSRRTLGAVPPTR